MENKYIAHVLNVTNLYSFTVVKLLLVERKSLYLMLMHVSEKTWGNPFELHFKVISISWMNFFITLDCYNH